MIADPLANLRPLTRRSRNLLVHGDGIERYDGKHKLLAAIIGGMLAAGWTVQEAADILCPETRSSFRLVRELQRRYGGRLASEVLGKWRAAERKHARHDELCDRWANVVFWCWPTARYPAVLRVALALARLAKRAGSTTFTASVRELAEAAGVGYASPTDADTKTVRSAVKRLIAWGIVTAHTVDRTRDNADTAYSLASVDDLRSLLVGLSSDDPSKGVPPLRRSSGVMAGQFAEQALHVVWEAAALGMTACRAWYWLQRCGSARPSALVGAVAASRTSVYGALARLEECRLAERDNDGTWRHLARDLGDVADDLGVGLRGDYRRVAYARQRQNRQYALRQGRIRYRRARAAAAAGCNVVALDDRRRVDVATGEIVTPGRGPSLCDAVVFTFKAQPSIASRLVV